MSPPIYVYHPVGPVVLLQVLRATLSGRWIYKLLVNNQSILSGIILLQPVFVSSTCDYAPLDSLVQCWISFFFFKILQTDVVKCVNFDGDSMDLYITDYLYTQAIEMWPAVCGTKSTQRVVQRCWSKNKTRISLEFNLHRIDVNLSRPRINPDLFRPLYL